MPSQTLSLEQSQRLQMILAPQLRQSLEMLQVPILELRTMIQQEIEQNPTIEETPPDAPQIEIEPGTGETDKAQEMEFEKEFETLARLDEEWRDYFYQDLHTEGYSPEAARRHQFMLDSIPQKESLQEHLLAQLHLTGLSDTDRQIGELIIGSINDDGYLTSSVADLAESTGFDLGHLEGILAVIHDFDPTGVGAEDLRECLLLQLDRLGKTDSLAGQIVRDHLKKLGGRKYTEIARQLKTVPEEVHAAARLIGTLDPKPGRAYTSEVSSYVLPEVVVQRVNGEYVVILNDDELPHVRISRHYRNLLQSKDTKPEVRNYIRERIRNGAFLIKSIHQRQRTIRRIATEIVESQRDFLDNGISHLKPMTMAEVAERVGVHETTVSRTVSGKYMRTPRGVFEMKYFFTPGIKTSSGEQISNKTVKDMIANMVNQESPDSPLSDQEIVARLKDKGIGIARRTVAKYRIVLGIPPSHMRKNY